MNTTATLLDAVKWSEHGLVPAIAQDATTNEVLMLAYMNRESLKLTLETGDAHYWSRSRKALWKKGETSGHIQHVRELRLDCDGDTLLMKVEQVGGIACHTGRRRCFFNRLADGAWVLTSESDPVLTSPGKFAG
ncbi:MAG: phosphoribosyl-AMP cyclohydrolase [Betaproteobacteria bacterium]|nr:phosphoribosyl-AMP cyclohydrolase [Betaproteobacteria bacterium]